MRLNILKVEDGIVRFDTASGIGRAISNSVSGNSVATIYEANAEIDILPPLVWGSNAFKSELSGCNLEFSNGLNRLTVRVEAIEPVEGDLHLVTVRLQEDCLIMSEFADYDRQFAVGDHLLLKLAASDLKLTFYKG